MAPKGTPIAMLINDAHNATVIDIFAPYRVFRKTDSPKISVPNMLLELGGSYFCPTSSAQRMGPTCQLNNSAK
jgi:hypothetical protein